jgi:hypothetical protein
MLRVCDMASNRAVMTDDRSQLVTIVGADGELASGV